MSADFFRPGVTYELGEFPGRPWRFRCDVITTSPEDGVETALGWRFWGGEWNPYAYERIDWLDGKYREVSA